MYIVQVTIILPEKVATVRVWGSERTQEYSEPVERVRMTPKDRISIPFRSPSSHIHTSDRRLKRELLVIAKQRVQSKENSRMFLSLQFSIVL